MGKMRGRSTRPEQDRGSNFNSLGQQPLHRGIFHSSDRRFSDPELLGGREHGWVQAPRRTPEEG
jgi:hypothetical protein